MFAEHRGTCGLNAMCCFSIELAAGRTARDGMILSSLRLRECVRRVIHVARQVSGEVDPFGADDFEVEMFVDSRAENGSNLPSQTVRAVTL